MTKKLTLILTAIAVAVCIIGIVLFFCIDRDYAFKKAKDDEIINREDSTEAPLSDGDYAFNETEDDEITDREDSTEAPLSDGDYAFNETKDEEITSRKDGTEDTFSDKDYAFNETEDDEITDREDGTEDTFSDGDYAFNETKDGRIISCEDGTEYTFLALEEWVVCLGEYEHIGRIKGEDKYLEHLGGKTLTGMYCPESGDRSGILRRILPDSEWYLIYRNAALPELDLSLDNLSRIEWINCWRYDCDSSHATCGYGLTGEKMHDFFKDVRSSKTAREAELRNPHKYMGSFTVLGYYEDEPNIAFAMAITSYNDKVYTIELPYEDCVDRGIYEGCYEEYIIPDNWLEELRTASHSAEIED